MRVMFALAEREGYPVDGYFPELVAAVDEGVAEASPGWYDEEVERARGAWGGEMAAVRHFTVDVPDAVVRAAFAPVEVDAPVVWVES